MLSIDPISDPIDPRLAVYRDLPDATLLARHGLFMAEGELVVKLAIDHGISLQSIVLTPARVDSLRPWLERAACPIYLVEPSVLEAVAGFHLHRGVLAAGRRPTPAEPSALTQRATRVLILEDLANHDNVGGLFRVAAAFGVQAVLLSPRCCDPLYRKAIRVSMGHALRIPFATMERWPEGLETLREQGFAIAAMTLGTDAAPPSSLSKLHAQDRFAVMVGTEGRGLSDHAQALATFRVRIPMAPGVDSLNVVVAAGIALAHVPLPH